MAAPVPPAPPAPTPGPRKPTPQEFEEKVTLARNVIGSLERALKTRRLYQPDHPLYQESTADLLSRFDAFFDKYSYLRFDVTTSELKMEGRAVMTCEPREPEVPFRLYKDGIREMKFQKGLTQQELLDYLSVLELDSKRLQEMDEDMVSLAWNKGFSTIQHTAIDEFEGVSDERWPGLDAGLVGVAKEIAEGVKETIRTMTLRVPPMKATPIAITGASGPDTKVLRRIRPPAAPAPEIEDADIDVFFQAWTGDVVKSVKEEVDNEGLSGAVERAFALLLKIVHGSKSIKGDDIGPFLRGLVSFYAARGDIGGIGHLVSRAQGSDIFDKVEGGAAIKKQVIEDAVAPGVRKYLGPYINGLQEENDGLKRYFDLAGAALVPDACAAYGKSASDRARATLRDFLIKYGRGNTTGWNDLLAASERYAAEVFDILRAVKPVNIQIDIDAILKRPEIGIRTMCISAIVAIDTWPRTRLLQRVLADPNEPIRGHVLRAIAEARDPGLRPLIQLWIEDQAFLNRTPDEKMAAFKALARSGGAPLFLYLRQWAEPKALSVKGADTRRAAVFAIKEIGTPDALERLRYYHTSGDDQLQGYAADALGLR